MCVYYVPRALGDGAQGHGLFDLGQWQHHSETGQRGESWVSHVVIGEVVVRVLAAQLCCKHKAYKSVCVECHF